MTDTVTTVTIQSILSSQYGPLSNGLGIIAIILLIFLLFESGLLEGFLGKSRSKILQVFSVAIIPLLVILAMLVGLRFADLLGLLKA
jgi:hypothetical protein